MVRIKELTVAALFAGIMAVLAQVAIPLPFSPVPITGQILGLFLTGALLGRRLGTWAVLLYLILGAIGLPVFSRGGAGIAHLLGPTGGYLWGFLVGVYLLGWMVDRGDKFTFLRTAGGMLICLAAVYILGTLQLAYLMHIPWKKAFLLGVLPFVPLDIVKLFLASVLSVKLRRILKQAGLLSFLH